MENNTKCVLLIDDDEVTNTLNSLTINDLGICLEVISFSEPEESFAYLNQNPTAIPSVVFVDYYMPSARAIDVVSRFKQISPNIKTIILSAYISPQEALKLGENANIDAIILKPLTGDKFVASLTKLKLI